MGADLKVFKSRKNVVDPRDIYVIQEETEPSKLYS